eukprot:1158095-Pelagomonas_calceolata.AAC.3
MCRLTITARSYSNPGRRQAANLPHQQHTSFRSAFVLEALYDGLFERSQGPSWDGASDLAGSELSELSFELLEDLRPKF